MTTTTQAREGCMTVTQKLLSVFRVDQQIQGLQTRLQGAERFLAEQTRQLASLGTEKDSIETQLRQLRASESNAEGESKRIAVHIDELREKMNNANTNKEYKAFLSEVNNLKEIRGTHDEEAIEYLEKIEALNTKFEEIDASINEREKVRKLAEDQRQERSDEIAEKLAELTSERERLIQDVPKDAMSIYTELLENRGEDAMAPLEIADRKRHEYVCGSSMMTVPVEVAASLMQGKLTLSPNDGCILYLTAEAQEELAGAFKK
ncbi:MAG: zinc ribbon domain-containing protein [Phycisphaerales bacterium]